MATLKIPDEGRILTDAEAVASYLRGAGIEYERWESARPVAEDAPSERSCAPTRRRIERLKAQGGYVTADVIDVTPQTPALETMLAKFNREHWHDEDEVRFIVRGRGLFHIHPREGKVMALEVEAGDLIRVPRGTWHWFDLCADGGFGPSGSSRTSRMDAALHRERRGQSVRAGLLRTRLPAAGC